MKLVWHKDSESCDCHKSDFSMRPFGHSTHQNDNVSFQTLDNICVATDSQAS